VFENFPALRNGRVSFDEMLSANVEALLRTTVPARRQLSTFANWPSTPGFDVGHPPPWRGFAGRADQRRRDEAH
jgi:hypothetical protein